MIGVGIRQDDSLKHVPTILAWAVVIAAGGTVVLAFLFGFGASYHPNSNNAHLRGFYGFYSFGVCLVALFVAFLLTSKRNVWAQGVRYSVLVAFGASVYAGFVGYVAMNPQASHYKQTVGGTHYAIPRKHANRQSREVSDVDWIYANVCLQTQSAYRGADCKKTEGVGHNDGIQLSVLPISGSFWVTDVLEAAKVPIDGDVLGVIPEGASAVVDGVTVIPNANARLMVTLDEGRTIQRAVWCREGYRLCTVFVRTEYGNLRHPSVGDAEVDVERWDRDQAAYAKVFAEWRCAEATCGGMFLDGAIVAYE